MRRLLAKTIAALALTTALAAAPALAPSAVWADDTLDRGVGSEWSSLDPQVNFDAAAGLILMDAYEGLVTFGPGGKILPGAAESWEISEDGLTYTFHLRDGLKWSNGDPLVAQDFVASVLRTLNPETLSDKGYYFYSVVQIAGAAALANRETTDPATLGVTAPDDRSVVIRLAAPAPHLLNILGAFQIPPLHGPSFQANGAAGFTDPGKTVSNGAYMFKEIVPQSHVLLVRNPNYWDAANVKIPQVKYHVTEDVTTELKRFEAGEIDVTYDVPAAMLDKLAETRPDELILSPATEVLYFDFNLTHEPLKDITLRTALSWAIDRETLMSKIVKTGAVPTYSYAGGFDPDYHGPQIPGAELTQAEREAKAKELFEAAGYGPGNPLKLTIVTTVAEDRVKTAQGIALMWKKVLGVEARVNPVERKAWLDSFYAGDWDVFADDLIGDFPGAETFLAYMRPSTEPGYNWVKPEFDAAMDKAATLTDKAARNAALAEAEKLLLDDMIFAPVAIESSRMLVSKHVHGWVPSALGYYNSQFLTLD